VPPPGTWTSSLPGGGEVRAGSRRTGDFADPSSSGALRARNLLADAPWTWLHQVHGKRVVIVDRPGAQSAEEADAAVTTCPGAALVVRTADCAPLGLSSREGVVAAVHAGWRGLMAGVVEETVAAMRALGATDVMAALGPCIAPHAYRFSRVDLDHVAARYGDGVVAADEAGYPALDLAGTVRAALESAGAALVADAGVCTHCSPDHWSWRANKDSGRQATAVWLPPPHLAAPVSSPVAAGAEGPAGAGPAAEAPGAGGAGGGR
jgi:polyphenol oxidase